jgi:hypothetical protein
MSILRTSTLNISDGCIIPTPATPSPFLPNTANLFPKLLTGIDASAWELWEFDTIGSDGAVALGCSLYRDARGVDEGGFHAEVNALWGDGRHWGQTLYFAESSVREEEDGSVRGVWSGENGSISFAIDADCEVATVQFDVLGLVEGRVELRSTSITSPSSRFPGTGEEAQLAPGVFYLFPMGPVVSSVTATFTFPDEAEQRTLDIEAGSGGMVRGWSHRAWPSFMNDAYYVVGKLGPYNIQILRILGSVFAQYKPRAVARLYYENEMVSAANCIPDPAVSEEDLEEKDVVRVSKVFAEEGGLAGTFRDKNTGYVIEFLSAQQGKEWRFEIRHECAVWSEATSAPGPDGTGKSGWIETFTGGAEGEEYAGVGFGGQLQIPVP